MDILTATHIIPAMRSALQADAWFSDLSKVKTIVCGHSGTFDAEKLPKPSIVLAPAQETNPAPPISRNAQKLVTVTIHGYTQHFGTEGGMIGDAHTLGVMELIDRLEAFFDSHLLADYLGSFSGWLLRAHALNKTYPDVMNMNYIGLNEARLTIEYLAINPALV